MIPGLGRSPGGGKGSPLQYSGLEYSMDCIVCGVTKSQTGLSDFHFSKQWNMFHNDGSKGSRNGQKGRIPACQPSIRDFSGGPGVKTLLSNAGSVGSIPGWKDPLEKVKAIYSSILAWKIPWTV